MAKNSDSIGKKGVLTSLSFAALAAATAFGGTAAAQTTEDPPADSTTDEIVIQGFRDSLAAAIDQKRDSVVSVDSILAEDIADFPDLNLSESIQRLPGVAITRDAGEGRQVTVRGLGPQFTRVRINGMEALSTGGGTDAAGGTNRDRSFDFNIFASDLFNSITVQKTASAETEEGSLGATLDLRTARPFDYGDFTVALSGQGGYNDLSEEIDPRAAFLISNTWADGRFGALFSIAYSNRTLLEEGASTVRYRTAVNAAGSFGALDPSYSGTPTLAQINAAFRPRIPRWDIYQHEQDRVGATLALQWRPSESTQFNLDILYARFEAERVENFLESQVFSTDGANGINDVDVVDAVIEGNTLVYGVFNDVDVRSESRYDRLSTDFRQYTLDMTHEFSPNFRFRGLLGHSESLHDNPEQTTLLFDAANIDGYSFDYRGDPRLPAISYGSTDVLNPSVWTLSQIRLRPQTADNTYDTAYGDFELDVAPWLSISAGVNWKRYEFESTELRRDPASCTPPLAAANGNAEGCIAGTNMFGVSPGVYGRFISLSGNSFDLPAGNQNVWFIPDVRAATQIFDLNNPSVYPLSPTPALGNNRSITEEDVGYYVQADWDTTLLGMPFRGNIGVRYVETDLSATGRTFAPPSTTVVTTVDNSYEDTLPSLNMVIEPFDDFLVRFSAARTMTRPGLGALSPGATVTASGANRTITAGNPFLEPFRADAYDLSFEWYFAEDSLLSLALFRKEIGSFVTAIRETLPSFADNPLGLPDSVAIAACGSIAGCSPAASWQFTQNVNTPGGTVEGYEIGLQLPFTFLPGPLSNFGVVANYTWVESEITYLNSTGGVAAIGDLQGLSRESYNATLYYEDDFFSARISANYRSPYLTNLPGRDGNATEETNETFNVDFSSSITISENLKLTFEGINLTDEVNDQYLTPDDRLSFYHAFGRSFFLGFRYTY